MSVKISVFEMRIDLGGYSDSSVEHCLLAIVKLRGQRRLNGDPPLRGVSLTRYSDTQSQN